MSVDSKECWLTRPVLMLTLQYLGVWYEAYKFPDIFELGQRCVSANYTLKDNGHIRVDNIGYT